MPKPKASNQGVGFPEDELHFDAPVIKGVVKNQSFSKRSTAKAPFRWLAAAYFFEIYIFPKFII